MAIESGDKLAILRRDVSGLSAHQAVLASLSGQLIVPFRRDGGGLAAVNVELVSADDDRGFPVRTDGGLAFVKVSGTPTEPPEPVPCADCETLLDRTFTVTLDGLTGDFAVANGAHEITLGDNCVGSNVVGQMRISLAAVVELEFRRIWRVNVGDIDVFVIACGIGFQQDDLRLGCLPETDDEGDGAYSITDCLDTDCDDTFSCDDSIGATCVVS